eukprot:1404311-Pleurochrysis_carterae.AAC.1
MNHGAQYADMRGKHSREGSRPRQAWKTYADAHLLKLKNASILSEVPCTRQNCKYQQQCMQSAFTLAALRNCAARVFGEPYLEGKGPSIRNHTASHIWFRAIFQCRVVNFEGVVESIDFHVNGRRICEEAFAAAYAIPPSTCSKMVAR